jgi:glyoxylase-like metal-dependent hydrolase (beta-lactamase superfamily II)
MDRSALGAILASALLSFAVGCAATTHPDVPARLGAPAPSSSLEAIVDTPGPVEVETVVGADWAVPLSGLLNLDHPLAKEARLTDHDEAIEVVFHVIRHPTRGMFIVDTGAERALFDDPNEAAIRGIVRSVAKIDKMKRRLDTKTWLARQPQPVASVFLTHLHADHISGMRDIPAGTPVFVGPGEVQTSSFENIFVAPVVDRALEGKPPLSVWGFRPDPDGAFDGLIDVFGDGSFWAIHVPGHTPGSTAFLARTHQGPVLLTGDACHTVWGWEHGVEPGSFSVDKKRSARSLAMLRAFVARHPRIDVRFGHQLRGGE